MENAQGYFQSGTGYQPYTGQTQASLNPMLGMTQLVMASQLQPEVNAGGSVGVNAARGLGLNMIENQGLSPELRSLYEQAQGDENPYLQSIIDASNRRISDKIGSSMSGATSSFSTPTSRTSRTSGSGARTTSSSARSIAAANCCRSTSGPATSSVAIRMVWRTA